MTKIYKNEQLAQFQPQSKEYLVDCGDSLFLRVRPNGSKSWFRRYTGLDGKRTSMGLGVFPNVTLDAARKENINISIALSAGEDPRQRRVDRLAAKRQASLDIF